MAALRPGDGRWREKQPCESGGAKRRRTGRRVGEMGQAKRRPALARRPDGRPHRARPKGEALVPLEVEAFQSRPASDQTSEKPPHETKSIDRRRRPGLARPRASHHGACRRTSSAKENDAPRLHRQARSHFLLEARPDNPRRRLSHLLDGFEVAKLAVASGSRSRPLATLARHRPAGPSNASNRL